MFLPTLIRAVVLAWRSHCDLSVTLMCRAWSNSTSCWVWNDYYVSCGTLKSIHSLSCFCTKCILCRVVCSCDCNNIVLSSWTVYRAHECLQQGTAVRQLV